MIKKKNVQATAASGLKPSSIGEYLDRMATDAEEIKSRLLRASIDLTGSGEPRLWEIINRVDADLSKAKKV